MELISYIFNLRLSPDMRNRLRFTIVFILSAAGLTGCVNSTRSLQTSTEIYLKRASTDMSAVASRIGIPVEESETIAVAGGNGGAAVFTPVTNDSNGFISWLDLPKTNACASQLSSAFYIVSARTTLVDAVVSLREIDGSARLEGVRVLVERISDAAPVSPMVRVGLGPDTLSFGRWFRCSDGAGHCGYALTLDESTPGCV